MKKDNKQALYESIMNSVAKQVKRVLNEYGNQTDIMSDVEWLNHRYASYDEYFQSVYDPVQNYAWYGLTSENIDQAKEMLSENPGINRFRTVRCPSGYRILCFKYTPEKDIDRQEAIAKAARERLERQRKEQEKYDEEFRNTDLTRFTYTQKDIDKMKQYYNKRSNPERLVASIKDDNKLVARWIAAMIIGWDDAVAEFEKAIRDRKILSKAEIAAYKEKFKEQASTDNSDMRMLDDTTKKLATSWISSSIFKWLEQQPVHTEWLESFTNAKTEGGREAMRRTGRAWSEGFVVKLTSLDDSTSSKTITFDIITNEGGGLYGYATGFSGTITLKELKEYFTRIINNL